MFGSPEPPVAAGDPSAWLLELGAAARESEQRVQHRKGRGRHISAWSSRRAGARARRLMVQQVLEATASEVTAEEPDALVVTPTPPDGTLMAPLLDRLSVYTHGEHAPVLSRSR